MTDNKANKSVNDRVDEAFLGIKIHSLVKKDIAKLLLELDKIFEYQNVITEEYSAILEGEYRDIIDNLIPETRLELTAARENGDLSENADYDAAREKLGALEGRILDIEAIQKRYSKINIREEIEIIKNNVFMITDKITSKDGNSAVIKDRIEKLLDHRVFITSKVHLKINGRDVSYTLVSLIEDDPLNGKLSIQSPLGQALLGNTAGSEVSYRSPKGETIKVQIVAIK